MEKNTSEYLLEMNGIVKDFPGVRALNGAGIKLRAGEVVALCGENGAGKSTLMKCLYGSYSIDKGEIYYLGKKTVFEDPEEAKKAGIIMIFQELSLIKDLTVAENMFLGSLPRKGRFVDWKTLNVKANQALKELGSTVKATDFVRDLPISQQQMVEIARGIALGAKILILDEPTSSLTEKECVSLFRIIRKLKSQGVGIIYISHKMDEIFDICDSAVVLRDGQLQGQFNVKDTNMDELIQSMIGRTLNNYYVKAHSTPGEDVITVENINVPGVLHDISFHVRAREVVGFYGLVGAGRSETMETIFGVRKYTSGRILINGKEVHIRNSGDAVRAGIGLVTEDRKGTGLLLSKSCVENISLVNLRNSRKGIFVDEENNLKNYRKFENIMGIKSPSPQQKIALLSGGNQQKVIIGKWLCTNPKLIILDEPTRGIDIGAKSEIHRLIAKLAEDGMAVIIISSEMPEIMGISQRIYTMTDGHITGELYGDEITELNLMKKISS